MDTTANKVMLRKEAIRNASEEVLAVYSDLELGDILFQTAEELCMSPERGVAFTHIVGDIILGIIPQKEFVTRVASEIGISNERAILIEKTIEPFLRRAHSTTSPTTQIPSANNELKEKLELRPEVPTPKPYTREVGADGSVKPLTREEVLQALAPKRTMASDIASIQEQTNTPKWGSEEK
jgi:hypothetical protein